VLGVLEGLLEIVGFEMTMEGIKTETHSDSWRANFPDFMSCNAETKRAKRTVEE